MKTEVKVWQKVIAPDFAKRFITALDNMPEVPPVHAGRHTWVRDSLKSRFDIDITKETVRKWCDGLATPRPEKLQKLAVLLEVDAAWLAFGRKQELDFREREEREIAIPGAAKLLAGFVEVDGNQIAYPTKQTSPIDFMSIIKGQHYAFHASLALPVKDKLKFTVTTEFKDCTVIGVVKLPGTSVHFVHIPTEVLLKADHKGGFVEVLITKDGKDYYFGKTLLKKIQDFTARL
jgi:transcriptional regulator with XRE-family HTH domain